MKKIIYLMITLSLMACSKEGKYKLTYDYTANKDITIKTEKNYKEYKKDKITVHEGDKIRFFITFGNGTPTKLTINWYLDGVLYQSFNGDSRSNMRGYNGDFLIPYTTF